MTPGMLDWFEFDAAVRELADLIGAEAAQEVGDQLAMTESPRTLQRVYGGGSTTKESLPSSATSRPRRRP